MATFLQWQEPRAVLDLEWQETYRRFKPIIFLGPILFILWIGFDVITAFDIFDARALLLLGLPLVVVGSYRLRRGAVVTLDRDGIRFQRWRRIAWKNVELYALNDYWRLPSMRQIKIKAKGQWHTLYFDPLLVSEPDLRALLHNYLPPEREVKPPLP